MRCYNITGNYSFPCKKRTETITDAWSVSKSGWTPYDGMKVNGWPVGTIVRGHVVMRDGDLIGEPNGMPANFQETIPIINRGPTSSQADVGKEHP